MQCAWKISFSAFSVGKAVGLEFLLKSPTDRQTETADLLFPILRAYFQEVKVADGRFDYKCKEKAPKIALHSLNHLFPYDRRDTSQRKCAPYKD